MTQVLPAQRSKQWGQLNSSSFQQFYSSWPSESGHTSALNYTVHSGGENKFTSRPKLPTALWIESCTSQSSAVQLHLSLGTCTVPADYTVWYKSCAAVNYVRNRQCHCSWWFSQTKMVPRYGRTTWVQPHNMSVDTSLCYPGTHNACCSACCTHGCILSVCHFSSWAWSWVLVLLILSIIVLHVHCTQVQIGMHASVPNTIIVHRVQLKTMRTIKQQLIPAVLQLYSPWPSESGHTSALNYSLVHGAFWWWK